MMRTQPCSRARLEHPGHRSLARLAVVLVTLAGIALVAGAWRPVADAQPLGRIAVEAGGPYSGQVGQPIVFTANVRSPLPPGTPFQFTWIFGDGGSAVGRSTTHVFTTAGSFFATVTVQGGGQVASDTARVTVTQPIGPLQVSAGGPYTGQAGRPVQFSASVSGAAPGATIQYQWSFGDGSFGGGPSPTHTYTTAATFQVSLQVSTSAGQQGFARTTVTVSSPVQPLIVSAGGPYTGVVQQPITFIGQAANIAPGAVPQYRWTFGDGTSALGQIVSHVYRAAGAYPVTLQVTTSAGQSGTASTIATVSAPVQPLRVSISGPSTGTAGQPVTFSGQASAPPGVAVSYQWQFGDGGSGQGQALVHTYTVPGVYSVRLQATTSQGQTGFATTSIRIAGPPQPLQVSAGGPYSGTAGSTMTFYAYGTGAQQPRYQWTFGDGAGGSGPTVAHSYQVAGTYTVTLTVTDLSTGQTASASTTATVSAPPVPPPAPPSVSPGARIYASVAYHPPTGRVVLFGGLACAGSTCADRGDTWTWDGATWRQESPLTSPPTRFGAVLAFHAASGQLVLFGGMDCEGDTCSDFDDTWSWDGSTWVQLSPANSPPERTNAALVSDTARNVLVLFGGEDSGGDILRDTWTWDGAGWTEQPGDPGPSARTGAAMAYDAVRGVVVLFGGQDQSAKLEDTWTWDGSAWTQLSTPLEPSARSFAGMAFDATRGVVLLFGGSGIVQNPLADTWTWNGTSWTEQRPATSPPPRYGAAMEFDPPQSATVLFSGTNGGNDTWLWDGSTWRQAVGGPPQ